MAWRVAESLLTLRTQVNGLYPGRSKTADGTIGDAAHQNTTSDHNPDSSGVVRALDITHDPAHGCDIDQLSDLIAATRDDRIKYMIANRLIMSGAGGPSPWVWRAYSGSDPHTGHLHLSVVADSRADNPRPWNIGVDMPTLDTSDIQAIAQNVTSSIRRGIWAGGYTDGSFEEGYRGGPTLVELQEQLVRIEGILHTNMVIDYRALAVAIISELASPTP